MPSTDLGRYCTSSLTVSPTAGTSTRIARASAPSSTTAVRNRLMARKSLPFNFPRVIWVNSPSRNRRHTFITNAIQKP